MGFKRWLEFYSPDGRHNVEVFHVTDARSAINIMRNGFSLAYRKSSQGVSVSVSRRVAVGMMRSVERMNSFTDDQQVIDWLRDKVKDVDTLYRRFQTGGIGATTFPNRKPANFYLYALYMDTPAIPPSEILWVDFAKKLIGKKVMCVSATYLGDVAGLVKMKNVFKNDDVTEAEYVVKDPENLKPNFVFDLKDNNMRHGTLQGFDDRGLQDWRVADAQRRLKSLAANLQWYLDGRHPLRDAPPWGEWLREMDRALRRAHRYRVDPHTLYPFLKARQYLAQRDAAGAVKHLQAGIGGSVEDY